MCADTGFVPPANGVIVNDVDSPAGFLMLIDVFGIIVSIKQVSEINDVPVALPTTVYACSAPFNAITNCPASVTLT